MRRSGFTLLEMLLASGIALLLMAGLYVSMQVNLNYTAAGRDVVDESQLARTLMNRIASDIASALTPITATRTAATTAATVVAEDTPATSFNVVTPLNMGVVGDGVMLTLYVSRVPRWSSASDAEAQPTGASDLHRISYWLSTAADGGLARQVIDRVTADDEETQLPPGVPNEDLLIVAPEVVGLAFRYFDGTGWVDTWDGAAIGDDLATPLGPPRAIEVKLDIRKPGATADTPGGIRSYRHVVAIGAANAPPTAPPETTGGGP